LGANIPDGEIAESAVKDAASGATGMYTGSWGSEGKVAILHEKELVLNQTDTQNILDAVTIARAMAMGVTSSIAGFAG
jgi:hypothetical protein